MMPPVRRQALKGQIAIGFLVLMAFALILVRMTINVGQMAAVRLETSNAADAGGLAAASWIASGQNEAALVSQKMWDSLALVQALYLAPFCPGAANTAYANTLWQSLVDRPGSLPSLAGDPASARYGVNKYFQDVADAAMLAGYMVGRREMLTSQINNMMIRYSTGESGVCEPVDDPKCLFGDLGAEIKNAQDQLYNSRSDQIREDLTWNNGLPVADPMHLKHTPSYRVQTGNTPPRLQMTSLGASYYQYNPRVELGEFDCAFEGVGIRNTTGPYPDLAKVPLQANPLKVDDTGRKGWDFDLERVIPGMSELDLNTCSDLVCGMQLRVAPSVLAQPQSILDGDGTVLSRVSHKVDSGSKERVLVGEFGDIPDWKERWPNVKSEAKASYTSAGVAPPDPRAEAKLESVK